ncbi:hypothetical protein JL720_14001 [Aureococcus anophagefferens]|nr:hypothetical protein JL720_14001 [Aureococcus anophagefferens]
MYSKTLACSSSGSDGDLSPAGKRPKSPKKSPKFGFGKKKAKAPDARPAPAPPSPEADDDAYEWATPELAHEASGRVPCEAVLGVYEMTSGPHVAVAVLDVRALRRATKVGVLPVAPKSAKRLNSKQKADEKLCLRLLHRALSEQPWVYSTRSPAATHTAPRVCELADVAAAEAAAVVANDGALVDAGAARWCAVAGHVVVDAVDLGATAAGDAAVVALIVTRTAVDHCGRRLSKRGLDAQCKAAATAETELLVAPRVALLKRKSSFANLASPQRKPSLAPTLAPTPELAPLDDGAPRRRTRRRRRGGPARRRRRDRSPRRRSTRATSRRSRRTSTSLATTGARHDGRLIARTAAWASVDGGRQESVRQRLKAAAAVLASAARGAKVRHVVVAPGADLGICPRAAARRRRVASRGAAAEPGGVDVSGVVLFVGCDEIDDVDEAMARAATLWSPRDDAAPGGPRALGDEAYARRQLLAAWRGHADALAVLRAGTAARWAPAAGGAAARSRTAGGRPRTPSRGRRWRRRATAHRRAYLKVAAAVFAVAAALRSQAGDARPAAILQHALLAVLAAIVLTFYAAFADGSLATALASARRFDDH